MSKKVSVVAKRDSEEIAQAAKIVCQVIQSHGLLFITEENLTKTGRRTLSRLKADLIVTVGGDGTVLKAVRESSNPKTPILGVNMGRRGYLTEVAPHEFEEALSRWINGDYQLEKLWRLAAYQNNRLVGEGLNEALMIPAVPGKMLSLDLTLAGRKLCAGRADGLIVATPTGSTAHAFSAGGPVLESSLSNFSVTFIAPLQPVRSIVVPADQNLRVRVDTASPNANHCIDGKFVSNVKRGESITFRRSSNNTFFVRFGDTFLQRSLRRLSLETATL